MNSILKAALKEQAAFGMCALRRGYTDVKLHCEKDVSFSHLRPVQGSVFSVQGHQLLMVSLLCDLSVFQ